MPISVMPWKVAVFVLVLLTSMFVAFAAFAQDDTIVIPYGNWVSDVIDLVVPVILIAGGTLVTWGLAFVPAWARLLIGRQMQDQINEVLEKAVLSAVAQTKGAVMGKTLTVNISNEVARRAVEYAIELAPELMKKATSSSVDALLKMIMGRMEDLGLTPAEMSIEKTQEMVKPETFGFDSAIAKGLGGK